MNKETVISGESVRFPGWLKLLSIFTAIAVLVYLVINYRADNDAAAVQVEKPVKEIRAVYPDNLSTIWPDITIRIDSLARITSETLIAEWTYINNDTSSSESFSWGFARPNFIALSQIIDKNKQEYPVTTNADGRAICSSTNRPDNSGWSKEIYGSRDFPAWAQFNVPENAPQPFNLRLHGLDHNDQNEIELPVMGIAEQLSRAYSPRPTNWPDIFIQLTGVERRSDGSLVVRWNYLNKNQTDRFIWGLNKPDFVSHTQIYDYSTGKYHNVERVYQNGTVGYLCSSTNREDNSGWSTQIPAGGELSSYAVFKNVKGRNIQILFHSAMPLFYNSDRPKKGAPRTN